jgi:multicomponent Na+:H+ antiporter subunit A
MPALVNTPLALAATSVTGEPATVTLQLWPGFTQSLVLGVLTMVGSLTLFAARTSVRRHAWPRSLRTDRLYTLGLSSLDRVSRAVSPALQSASLRSYALVTVVTGVTLVGSALGLGRVVPEANRWTPIQPHEAAISALIAGAALSAAFASSNMAAVLSLGTVGYGVALIYVLFGAPDLAMTQFAVETLTVVIFVLVFYQLRGFGDLSPVPVRMRDATIATAAGAIIGALVLFIGTSGTTSRLAEYYADAAPRLAHGRNIVNVTLVDFRGIDTLGEITVLVTVAIGVRALLRIGRERHP